MQARDIENVKYLHRLDKSKKKLLCLWNMSSMWLPISVTLTDLGIPRFKIISTMDAQPLYFIQENCLEF